MLTQTEKIIIEDYRKAFRELGENVVDLDHTLNKKLEYYLVRMEDIISELGPVIPPFRQSKFIVIYISKGSGKKLIGDVEVRVKDRTLMLVPSRMPSSSEYTENTKGYSLSFNLPFFLQQHFPRHHLLRMTLFCRNITPYVYVVSKRAKALTGIFETILDEDRHLRKNKEELIALKVLELIIFCDRFIQLGKLPGSKFHPPVLNRYLDMVHEHHKEQHSTTYYAKKLHVHPNALNAITRRFLGQSAKSVITVTLITESQYLLRHTNQSIKEIAYDLGFNSSSHFFRFFKNHMNQSPAHYRENV